MREILFRAKELYDNEWIEGFYVHANKLYSEDIDRHFIIEHGEFFYDSYSAWEVKSETVGQYTGLTDKNGKKIFEGDIVEYNTFNDFDCYSIVKIGEYIQDGSGGEYRGRNCNGVYVEVDNFTCPDWADNDPLYFSEYLWQQNLAEVNAECEIIGNIHDNPELLGVNHE